MRFRFLATLVLRGWPSRDHMIASWLLSHEPAQFLSKCGVTQTFNELVSKGQLRINYYVRRLLESRSKQLGQCV